VFKDVIKEMENSKKKNYRKQKQGAKNNNEETLKRVEDTKQ